MVRTHRSLSARWLWCMRARHGCLEKKRGSLGTSSVVARGGGATDVTRWRGVVAAAT
jgi:hypothetical protein